MQTLTIRRPDDWHVHFRDGPLLKQVVPFTARQFARAIVMPNLIPPVVNAKMAAAYRQRILAVVPAGVAFEPLMTCYLTDTTDGSDLVAGHRDRIFTAAKLYPAHATTNADEGVTDIKRLYPVLAAMEQHAIPLLVHGEFVHADVDIFDRERAFIDRVLKPTLEAFPRLKIVLEHVTTSDGVDVVRANRARMAATLTPQHLLFNRNAIFAGGIRPHMYCLPVLKREKHRIALRAAATSGESCFFLGTDSAPHLRHLKEAECGCAGVFSAPVALQAYLRVFAEENALAKFEAFASLNGPAFYGLPANESRITLVNKNTPPPTNIKVENLGEIVPLFAGEQIEWSLA
ncbi:MAG: dihydroorotase [Rhizobiales bacterium]|nr:dihydroorotase [Hyphomicrobiales bacterium]